MAQSAGAAATLVAKKNITVQDLSYPALRMILEDATQILTIPKDWKQILETSE